MMMVDMDDLIKKLYKTHPDKMVLDNVDDFTRGRLVGHIEIILEIEAMIKEEEVYEKGK